MTRRMARTFNLCAVCFIVLVVAVFQMPGKAYSMVMSPYKIVLNSELVGENQDIQAIIPDPGGCATIKDFELTLFIDDSALLEIDGEEVADAFAVRYCVIDDNFLISFSREDVHNYIEGVILNNLLFLEDECKCKIVGVSVEGWVTVECTVAGGETQTKTLELKGKDTIEVYKPGQKPEKEEESEVNLKGRSD